MIRRIIKTIILGIHIICIPLFFIFALLSRYASRRIDIGIGPEPMINNVYWAEALRKKGYSVETYVYGVFFITDKFDFRMDLGYKRIFRIFPGLFFCRAICMYKCMYIYFNGGPLQVVPVLKQLEPILYHIAGIKTVVMPYGSDSQVFERTPNKLTAYCLCSDYPVFFRTHHDSIRAQVDRWCRYGDIVVGAMDSVDYLWYWNAIRHCHFAVDTDVIKPMYSRKHNNTVKIFHAPNHLNIKGTQYILDAITQLKRDGYDIELIYKRGVSNKELLDALSRADIVVDQLIMGWYAAFSIEAMASGKPVICALRSDLKLLYENSGCIEKDEIPLLDASPTTVKDVIKNLLDNPDTWYELGRKSRVFAEKYHSLDALGAWFDIINKKLGVNPTNRRKYA